LNFLLLNRLKSTCLISLLMQLDQSICSCRLIEPSLNLSHKNSLREQSNPLNNVWKMLE
jgi:hypothetical protein